MKQSGIDQKAENSGKVLDDEEDYWREREDELRPILKAARSEGLPEESSYFRNLHQCIMTAIVEENLKEKAERVSAMDQSKKSKVLRKNENSKTMAN